MLAIFRRFANTWAARLFFMLLVAAFGLWGIADVIRNVGTDTSVATVGGQHIEIPAVQEAVRRQLAQWQRATGGKEPTTEMRRAAVEQSVQRLVTQAAIEQEVARLHLAVPDDALRAAVYEMPAFHGPDGTFDRARFQSVLQNNGLTEQHFLALMRGDLGQRQLLEPVQAGASASQTLARAVFEAEGETRVAAYVELPVSAAPEPPAPSDAQLTRFYDNNPDSYSTPEYRRIKAVVLSAQTVAKSLDIPEDEMRAWYEAHKGEFVTPERRTVQVIQTQDEAKASELAAKWRAGADWAAMQKAATEAGANPVELTAATEAEIPAPELARAAFSAQPETVPDPVHGALGWYVLRVAAVQPGAARSYDEAKAEIRDRLAAERAGDLLYDRSNKLEDALASGTSLDELPADLGLAGVTGTLDAQGNTKEGTPAPIPGGPELRQALVAAAFSTPKGEPPHLNEVDEANGGSAWYALVVEDIIPAARRPFDEVKDEVREDYLRDARRHAQEAAAAKLFAAVKSGQSLDDAATVAGLHVARTPPVGRGAAPPGVPPELAQALFGLKKREATMVETGDGFVVAQLDEVRLPDPAADPVGFNRTRAQLTASIAQDLQLSLASALRDRARPRVNTRLMETLAEP